MMSINFLFFKCWTSLQANHLFLQHNTDYDTVHHPVLGGVVCLVAVTHIDPGDEVTSDYLYVAAFFVQ